MEYNSHYTIKGTGYTNRAYVYNGFVFINHFVADFETKSMENHVIVLPVAEFIKMYDELKQDFITPATNNDGGGSSNASHK